MMAPINVSMLQTRKVNRALRMIANRSMLSPECKCENCNHKRSKWTKANLRGPSDAKGDRCQL